MSVNIQAYKSILTELKEKDVVLIAVSKKKSVDDIKQLYDLGQRDFGENYVQELCEKQELLPYDIKWHFIGHLQTNKVKFIAPFVHLIHGVDSIKLLVEINKQGLRLNKVIDVLLQVYVATEETKYGMDQKDILEFVDQVEKEKKSFSHVRICGVMGMASFTEDDQKLKKEFQEIRNIFEELHSKHFKEEFFSIVSMV